MGKEGLSSGTGVALVPWRPCKSHGPACNCYFPFGPGSAGRPADLSRSTCRECLFAGRWQYRRVAAEPEGLAFEIDWPPAFTQKADKADEPGANQEEGHAVLHVQPRESEQHRCNHRHRCDVQDKINNRRESLAEMVADFVPDHASWLSAAAGRVQVVMSITRRSLCLLFQGRVVVSNHRLSSFLRLLFSVERHCLIAAVRIIDGPVAIKLPGLATIAGSGVAPIVGAVAGKTQRLDQPSFRLLGRSSPTNSDSSCSFPWRLGEKNQQETWKTAGRAEGPPVHDACR
jgi:hypothetical protein